MRRLKKAACAAKAHVHPQSTAPTCAINGDALLRGNGHEEAHLRPRAMLQVSNVCAAHAPARDRASTVMGAADSEETLKNQISARVQAVKDAAGRSIGGCNRMQRCSKTQCDRGRAVKPGTCQSGLTRV